MNNENKDEELERLQRKTAKIKKKQAQLDEMNNLPSDELLQSFTCLAVLLFLKYCDWKKSREIFNFPDMISGLLMGVVLFCGALEFVWFGIKFAANTTFRERTRLRWKLENEIQEMEEDERRRSKNEYIMNQKMAVASCFGDPCSAAIAMQAMDHRARFLMH